MSAFIYALIDPRNEEIRYIGKSVNPAHRFKYGHMNEFKRYKSGKVKGYHKLYWIDELHKEGLEPRLCIIEEVQDDNWQEREKQFIRNCILQGCRLVNISEGGDGCGGMKGRRQTEKQRQIMRDRWKNGFSIPREAILRAAETRKKNHPPKPTLPKPSKEQTQEKMRAMAKGNERRANLLWTLQRPDGSVISIRNLAKFCKIENLDYSSFLRWKVAGKLGLPSTAPRIYGWVVLSVQRIMT